MVVPVICLYEVFKVMLRERNQSDALQAVATMQEGDVITVDEELALSAAQFSHEMKLPMAGSIIYSVARKKEAKIWTQDSDFKDLPGVGYLSK